MERQVPSGYGGGLALGGAVCVGIQASKGGNLWAEAFWHLDHEALENGGLLEGNWLPASSPHMKGRQHAGEDTGMRET
jgi:hypothetical protein